MNPCGFDSLRLNYYNYKKGHGGINMSSISKQRTVKFISMITSITIIIPLLFILFSGSDVNAASINSTDVTLYGISDTYKDLISLPSGKASSFQLKVSGAEITSCRVKSGNSCKVSQKGLIEINVESIYTIGLSGGSGYKDYMRFGDSVVECVAGGVTYTVDVHVIDYATSYADQKIAEYLNENIKSGMTDQEIMNAIAKYPATFDYSAKYQSYVSMIICNGGDCWASTNLIIRECEILKEKGILDIDAWGRNANRDAGAGSGHRNVIALYNGNYYMLEAGYSGNAPRPYYATKLDSLYSTVSSSYGGVMVYQYNGKSGTYTSLDIPSKIGGQTVTAVDQSFTHDTDLTSVKLPDTIKSIGSYAFSGCTGLKSFKVPSSVVSIGQGAFAKCSSLTSLTVDSSNKSFCSENNTIYSKDKKTLVASPVASSVNLPSGLEKIANYAFYYNANIKSITVPSSVKSIGEGAFGNCDNLTSITFEGSGLTTLGDFAFAYTPNLKEVVLPSSLTTISKYAFYHSRETTFVLKNMKAPSLPDDFAVGSQDKIVFKVPKGATGYDQGKWADLTIEYYDPSSSGGNGNGNSGTQPLPPSAEKGVAEFVERLYTVALGRSSDKTGKADWVNRVMTKGYTGADCAEGFLYSPEFLNKNMSNADFVEILYKTFFNRASDAAGKKDWLSRMDNGWTKQQVIRGFIDSTEWANLCLDYGIPSGGKGIPNKTRKPNEQTIGFATRLYTTCLGRKADENGLMDWATKLANMKISGTEAAYGFFFSKEFKDKNLSDEEFIKRLYKTFMDRDPDSAGFNDWKGRLANGASREDVFYGFANSTEFGNICASYGIVR